MSTVSEPASQPYPEGVEDARTKDLPGDIKQYIELDLCGIALASISADGRPIVGKGSGYVLRDGALRITARKPANEELVEAVLRGAPVAVTFSRPTTHGSVQYKAPTARLDDPVAEDYLAATRQRENFSAELIASAYTPEFTEKYTAFAPHELVVVEIIPETAFDQTPGPAAGARLR